MRPPPCGRIMPSMAADHTNLGRKPTIRDYSFMDLAMRAWGSEFSAPDHGAYEFSDGRKCDSTDRSRSGIYGIEITEPKQESM